jgi:hypothetical protein
MPPVERPYVPMAGINHDRTAQQQWANQKFGNEQLHTAAVGSVVVGLVAFSLSIVGLIPGSPVMFYSFGGVFAIIGGVRALSRRSQGYRTRLWAPVLAIVLGSLAALIMGSELILNAVARSDVSSSSNTAVIQTQGQTNSGPVVMATAPTFATDTSLTRYEAEASQIAQSLDLSYGARVATDVAHFPSALSAAGGSIVMPNGQPAAALPADEAVKYNASSDGAYFDVYVTGGDKTEIAVYDSKSNTFNWVCDTGAPASCPAGGIDPTSGDTTGSSS